MFRSVPTVFAALVLVFLFTLTGCNFPWERSIKLIDVDDKNINLEIDGKKAHIPLPEGYVVADRELYAKLYERIEASAAKFDDLFLCLLVNADDNKIRQKDPTYRGYRFCQFNINYRYIKMRFDGKKTKNEIPRLKERLLSSFEEGNSELVKDGLSPFTNSIFFENEFSISLLEIEERASQEEPRLGLARIYFGFGSIIVEFIMYHDIYNKNDIIQLENETLAYGKSIGKQ